MRPMPGLPRCRLRQSSDGQTLLHSEDQAFLVVVALERRSLSTRPSPKYAPLLEHDTTRRSASVRTTSAIGCGTATFTHSDRTPGTTLRAR